MSLEKCPHCSVRVIPSADGICPSCRRPIRGLSQEGKVDSNSLAAANPYQSPISVPEDAAPFDQEKLIARGGKIFWVIIAINISPMIWALLSSQPLESPGLGTFLSMALLYFLWRGQPWAKWTTIVLFAPMALLVLIAGVISGNLLFFGFGGLMAFVPLVLLFSKSLNAFLLNQRWSGA
jgi:hypothetical protein